MKTAPKLAHDPSCGIRSRSGAAIKWLAIPLAGFAILTGAPGQSAAAVLSTAPLEYHVATNGTDLNPGTVAAPFATLGRARGIVRTRVAAGLAGDIRVTIHGGVYLQDQALIFGPEDSGSEKYSITYMAAPGEEVVLSGGQRIGGWKPGAGGVWTTEIPEVIAGHWSFRQLFINGHRAIRARTPNADAKEPWWQILTSSASKEDPPAKNDLLTVKLSGPVQIWTKPADVELVYTQNNESARKRVAEIDGLTQTVTLAPPHRWNPKVFSADWYLSIPFAGKPCYLENAREMLDAPGEWYLDRQTGVLSYWPRAGEDLRNDEVVAPVRQNTLLAVMGTREQPVMNLHFQGLEVEYVDWPLPPWGYMAMFCCNVATTDGPKPGHRPIEAAVEFVHAQACSFTDGGILHAGGMGICLREGTARITIEGNEIGDLGGGGIAAGWPNSAAGYLNAAPPPLPGEFAGYRIANNHVHDCGTDYFGAVGILIFPMRDSVVAHNLIHHTAYIGIAAAGSQDPKVTFDGGNVIADNHLHDTMMTTVDGAGIYITFAHHGAGTLVRGNLIHDTAPGKGRVPSAGLYLDGSCSGCQFVQNVIYRNNAAGPLIFNYDSKKTNTWADNLFQPAGTPPVAFLEALGAGVGLEPAYRARLQQTGLEGIVRRELEKSPAAVSPSVIQYNFAGSDHGVVQVTQLEGGTDDTLAFKLPGLNGAANYELTAYSAPVTAQGVWGGPGVSQQMPMLGETNRVDLAALTVPRLIMGHQLAAPGLTMKPGKAPRVLWIVYQRKTQHE